MTESWRQLMDIGLVHFMAYPTANDSNPDLLLESIKAVAQDDFFDVLEVRPSKIDGMHAQIKGICDQAGVKLGVGVQPLLLGAKLSLNDLDEARRQEAIAVVKGGIDTSYELGARICACLSGPRADNDADNAKMMDLLVDSCVQICKYSQSKAGDGAPVWLSVEQFDTTVEKKSLIGSSEETAAFAERVRAEAPNFGITIDLSHIPILFEDTRDLVTITAPYVIHLHAGNAVATEGLTAYGDAHPRFDFPGGSNGQAELQAYLEALIYAGVFQNEVPTEKMVFTFEVKPVGDESTELILAQTKRTFQRAWAAL